jgi:hypothetical protein
MDFFGGNSGAASSTLFDNIQIPDSFNPAPQGGFNVETDPYDNMYIPPTFNPAGGAV